MPPVCSASRRWHSGLEHLPALSTFSGRVHFGPGQSLIGAAAEYSLASFGGGSGLGAKVTVPWLVPIAVTVATKARRQSAVQHGLIRHAVLTTSKMMAGSEIKAARHTAPYMRRKISEASARLRPRDAWPGKVHARYRAPMASSTAKAHARSAHE